MNKQGLLNSFSVNFFSSYGHKHVTKPIILILSILDLLIIESFGSS